MTWGNQGGYGGPPPAQGGQQRYQRTGVVIGSFTAAEAGQAPGKMIEFEIEERPTQRGGKFTLIQFFKPYKKQDGTMGKGFGVAFPDGMRDLVNAINVAIRKYCPQMNGQWVWQSFGQQPQPQHQGFDNYPNHGQPGSIMGGQPAQPQGNYPPQGQPQQGYGGAQTEVYQYNPQGGQSGGGWNGPR